ncbi:MAG: excinuclease ABC subunit B [Parcubacteria group bacterium]|nr:excinuclease ABC subunit B [Parcubacteria group bacterium]
MKFKLESKFKPAGDQPKAIKALVKGVKNGDEFQTLLGVTGSGKTYVMANVIEKVQKPTLIIVHNKTLAAQLCSELREFFPNNAVEYFVSYYDYYQPEAYVSASDTYIDKEAQVNDEIDRLRHSATQSLLTRRDVIIVASVSCIFSIGAPEEYMKGSMKLTKGQTITRGDIMRHLVEMQFIRTNADVLRGQFRVRGDVIELHPVHQEFLIRITLDEQKIAKLEILDTIKHEVQEDRKSVVVFPSTHYVTGEASREKAIKTIRAELNERLKFYKKEGKVLESERIERRTKMDLEMMKNVGFCHGIENYSRHFDGRRPGEAPTTLVDYFPDDFMTIIDESHVTVPQIRGMYAGDHARKKQLVEYGFRLPSAIDNRPLQFDEYEERIKQTIFTSATPSVYEKEHAGKPVEMIVRPTGLVDPEVIIKPVTPTDEVEGQIDDLLERVRDRIKKGERVLVTTLTKKMAEDLTDYINEEKLHQRVILSEVEGSVGESDEIPRQARDDRHKGAAAVYIHSDVKTIERLKIIEKFRRGDYDVLVGVNLLREGLDLPEVTLVAILDADKEGFLRSETSIIQTMGRAARNVDGQVVLYADKITGSLQRAIDETERRREIQLAYNKKHNITPQTIQKKIKSIESEFGLTSDEDKEKREKKRTVIQKIMALELAPSYGMDPEKIIKQKTKDMREAAANLEFELAAIIRDEIKELSKQTRIKKPRRK